MSHSSTSNSKRRDFIGIVRFAARFGIFCAPLFLCALAFEFAMYRTGDAWPIKKVIEAEERAGVESILGRANFSQQYNLSKSEMMRRRRPRIFALGSSRVMEFRNFMFHPHEADFYNGGGLIQNINDLVAFARQVREGRLPAPEVIIVGVDPWWVSESAVPVGTKSWLDGAGDAAYDFSSHVEAARLLLRTGKSAFPWRVVVGLKERKSPAYGYAAYGSGALSAGIGERFSDGSFLYTNNLLDYLKNPVYRDRLAAPVLDQIEKTYAIFAPSTRVDTERARLLVESLSSLKQQGIEVYAYEPPFPTEVMRALDNSKLLARYWSEYKNELRAELKAVGIDCLPVKSPTDYGLDDRYMLDGLHASEVLDTYILKELVLSAPQSSLLASIDLNYLSALRTKENVMPLAFDPPPTSAVSRPDKIH